MGIQIMLDMYSYSKTEELMAVLIKERFTPESYAAYPKNHTAHLDTEF
jgi:hypothetical protein